MAELKPWLQLILKQRRRLFVGALLLLLTLLSGLGLLALSGWFITATAVTGLLWASGVFASLNIYVPGGGIRLFAVARTVSRYLERVYNHDTVLRLLSAVRIRMFRELAAISQTQRTRLQGSDWMIRLTGDLDAMDALYLRLIAPSGLALSISALLVLVAYVWLSPTLALSVAGALALAFLVATVLLHWRNRQQAAERTVQLGWHRNRAIQYLEGQAEVTAAGLSGQLAETLCTGAETLSHTQWQVDQRIGWHQALATFLVHLGALLALWFGLQLHAGDTLSGPVAVALPLAILGLVEVYTLLPDAFGQLGATVASAGRLNRDCAFQTDRPPAGQGRPAAGQWEKVSISNLVIRTGTGPAILDGFSLEVPLGQWLGIVGQSGGGKSSLADAVAGVGEVSGGHIRGPSGASEIAYLTQRTVLLHDSVRNNLVPDGRPMADDRLWRVLAMVGLADRIARMPAQLDAWLGPYGTTLSGGEGRRLALARVLLSEASLIVLDEPFTGLDKATQASICQQLPGWLESRTVIALAHSPSALPPMDRIIHLG
ncbi:MAG: ATP-binding cassette domain-containing protein [Marinobacter sp.]|uniref:amino acid ABC transporter ATP-binding/permease protein n=1 Tax=Marinobacter sp. TaxID=50741 RepID=UPI00299DE6C9|nr:ATP-binding cassette domain-containing protein [Marinobacter sp.]MDX1755035.1 ATP-binding cassette domain-containing protein [Marinobacter sp.]